MFDYNHQVYEFIKQYFTPAYPDQANIKYTSDDFLSFLFLSFPLGCISDYELNEILISLDFERFVYSIERITIDKDDDGEETITKSYQLVNGWCMFTNKIPGK